MEFNPSKFVDSLYYLGTGMVSIFIVIGVIILMTMLINKVFKEKSDKAE